MPHEYIRQEQQPVLTPERGEVDSGLENAEQTVDVIEEHIRDADPHAGPNDVDEAVAEFVHSADGTENDLVEEQAADVGVVEMKRNPSAWRTALSFMKLPLEKVAAALRKLEPTAADQVTAVVDRAEHDIADKTVDRGGNSTGSLAGQESDNEHGGLHAGDHIPDLASTEALQSRETLQSRSERAIESCDFVRSPEVEHAITSYYEDHYKLADMIASVADGTLADEKKRAILAGGEDGENFVMNEVTRAAVDESAGRSDQLRQLYELTNTHLFREVSLPATTIGEQEAATVVALQQKVLDAARKEGVLQGKEGLEVWTGLSDYQGGNTRAEQLRNVATIQGEKQRIEAAKQSFWDDTRNAGQLLFHNTPTIDQIARNSDPGSIGPFSVSSRSAQLERSGRFNETTGSVAGQTAGSHSNLVHWSENFTPLHYKHRGALKGGHGENAANYKPGTIAVPIC